MLKNKKVLYFTILSLIFQIFIISNTTVNKAYAHQVSKAEYVLEVNSGKVFNAVNENKKLPIASTTKIITAITVIENFDLNKIVTVPNNCVNIEGSSVYLRAGEKISVLDLLYGLMLRSGNDCAETLACTLTDRQSFINLMNETAKKLGATNTNLVNPHGLHNENHYSTAKDLCLITKHALKNEIFSKIVSTKRQNISNDGFNYDRVLINKNKMLSFYEGCTGVKTGYTKKAGRCLVSSVKKNGFEIVAVVINSPEMWERSSELYDNVFNNYEMLEVYNCENLVNSIFTDSNGNKFKIECYGKLVYPIKKDNKSNVSYKVNGIIFKDFLKNPTENGIFEIFYENKLIFSQNIFTILCK